MEDFLTKLAAVKASVAQQIADAEVARANDRAALSAHGVSERDIDICATDEDVVMPQVDRIANQLAEAMGLSRDDPDENEEVMNLVNNACTSQKTLHDLCWADEELGSVTSEEELTALFESYEDQTSQDLYTP